MSSGTALRPLRLPRPAHRTGTRSLRRHLRTEGMADMVEEPRDRR